MIHLSREDYSIISRNNIWFITGNGKACCPVCDGELRVRGTCYRKMRTFKRTLTLRLRILICKKCGKTHRELPHFLIPYKRYCMRCIAEILMDNSDTYPCETSTRARIRKWWQGFCSYVERNDAFRALCARYFGKAEDRLTNRLSFYVHWRVKLNL